MSGCMMLPHFQDSSIALNRERDNFRQLLHVWVGADHFRKRTGGPLGHAVQIIESQLHTVQAAVVQCCQQKACWC